MLKRLLKYIKKNQPKYYKYKYLLKEKEVVQLEPAKTNEKYKNTHKCTCTMS